MNNILIPRHLIGQESHAAGQNINLLRNNIIFNLQEFSFQIYDIDKCDETKI